MGKYKFKFHDYGYNDGIKDIAADRIFGCLVPEYYVSDEEIYCTCTHCYPDTLNCRIGLPLARVNMNTLLAEPPVCSWDCVNMDELYFEFYTHQQLYIKNAQHISHIRRIYYGMKQRCYNPKSSVYKYYGARGIKISDEWDTSDGFVDWAILNGYKPGLSIDRIDCDGDYEPSNCRWATAKQQANNRRNCKRYKERKEKEKEELWQK